MFTLAMKSKRGILGDFVASFWATIAIFILLIVYVSVGGVFRSALSNEKGISVESDGIYFGHQEAVIISPEYRLKNILNCVGSVEDSEVTLFDYIDSGGSNVLNFIEENSCAHYDFSLMLLDGGWIINCFDGSCLTGGSADFDDSLFFYVPGVVKLEVER